jgi:hypothetical protein
MPRPHGAQAVSWWTASAPVTFVSLSATSWIGVTFKLTALGRIAGMRMYIPSGETAPAWGVIYDLNNFSPLRAVVFRQDVTPPVNGWMNAWFRPWLRINTTDSYRVMIQQGGGYSRTNTALASTVTHNHVSFLNSFQSTSLYPPGATITTNTNANGVDVLFQPD